MYLALETGNIWFKTPRRLFINSTLSRKPLSSNIKARIASAIKSGYGILNKTHTFGRVYISDNNNYYIFDFNEDGSATIRTALNSDQDSEIITIIEEELNADIEGKRNDQDVNAWLESFWIGQRYNNNNSRGDVSSFVSNGRANVIYGNTSQFDSGRSGKRSNKTNQNHIKKFLPISRTFTDISGRARNVFGIGKHFC